MTARDASLDGAAAARTPVYRRLSGRGSPRNALVSLAANQCTLWLADDHLLLVRRVFCFEQYRRFFLADIQAIVVRATAAGRITTVVALFIGVLAFVPAVALGGNWLIGLSIPTAALWGFAFVNWLRGPTCVTHIMTAVQTEELPSLGRLRTARRVTGQLRPLIQARQPSFPENLPPLTSTTAAEPPQTVFHGRFHALLFGGLLTQGALCAMGLAFFNTGIVLVLLFVTLAVVAAAIVALVKQHAARRRGALAGVTWIAFGYLMLCILAGYVAMVYATMQQPDLFGTQMGAILLLGSLDPLTALPLFAALVTGAVAALGTGCLGTLLLLRARPAWRRPPPLPASTTRGGVDAGP